MIVSECYSYKNDLIRLEYENGNKFFSVVSQLSGKTVRVKCTANSNYSIKINKSSISGQNGAGSVFCFLADCIKNDFMLVYVNRMLDRFYFA